MKDIKNILQSILGTRNKKGKYNYKADSEGLNFFISEEINRNIQNGKEFGLAAYQDGFLRSLAEIEQAEIIPNGFIVPTKIAVNLDQNTKKILDLPPDWKGKINANIKGTTSRANFSVDLSIQNASGGFTGGYEITGPILELSSNQKFMLSPAQYLIFNTIEEHRKSKKTEYDNLNLILNLQTAQKEGADISLGHFKKLDIKVPKFISIEVETDPKGNLIITPFMGQNSSHDEVSKRLGQLSSRASNNMRVGDEIILFDERKLAAMHEIISNRNVPKKHREKFFAEPAAFIDASLVDLDLGFSHRVRGVTKFKHAYFGETEQSNINWLGNQSEQHIYPITKLASFINNQLVLDEFKKIYEDAKNTGAQEMDFENKTYDISDQKIVSDVLNEIKARISNNVTDDYDYEDKSQYNKSDNKKGQNNDVAVVDVALNDEYLDMASPAVKKLLKDILYPEKKIDWSNYLRTPFPHQIEGVRWILGLATTIDSNNTSQGGLLADDMGLGKTFMALSALDQLYKIYHKQDKVKKPALIVAPLSLLENWKDEVNKTFSSSPFKDIIILHADEDLKKYKEGRIEIRNQNYTKESEATINYSLKVGKSFGFERLDLPERIVITNYNTLRDYQFSLCLIDWGMVIFDEAQNIKNPNTLATRAAKGLKADFKLITTGTPVENTLADFWCLMDTALPGYLGSYQDFKQKYISPITQCASDEVEEARGRIGRELRLKVGSKMLRRLKKDNLEGLPKKSIFVGIEDERWLYKKELQSQMMGEQLESYNLAIKTSQNEQKNSFFSTLHSLANISLHPDLVNRGSIDFNEKKKSQLKRSAKMTSLIAILEEIQKKEEKCIIFMINKSLQHSLSLALGQHFKLARLAIINGDSKAIAKRKSIPTRKSMIEAFEKKIGFNIIIMSPIAAGVGLTVTGANHVIHFQRHWNPAKEDQATDRVYRIGQEKDVNVYIPILHHPEFESFDVNLHKLVSKKTLLKDAVVTSEDVTPSPGGLNHINNNGTCLKIKDLTKISWEQFEAFCAVLMAKELKADSCWLTSDGADFGADVVITNEKTGCLIQIKHTKHGSYSGYKAITEIHSSRVQYEDKLRKSFERLIFMTNAKTITEKVREIAKKYQVEVIALEKLEMLLKKHKVTYQDILCRLSKDRLSVN